MSRHFICYSVLRPKWLTSGPRTRSRRRSNWSRRPKVSKRLPLSGSRRIFWRDGRENAVGCLLDELQAFQKQLRVSSVKADVVPRGGSCFKTNRRTNHVCHRLRLGLTDTFRCLLAPLAKMHFRVGHFMHQRCEHFRRSLFGKQSDFAFFGHCARWRDFARITKFDAFRPNELFKAAKIVAGVAPYVADFRQPLTFGLLLRKQVRDLKTTDDAFFFA